MGSHMTRNFSFQKWENEFGFSRCPSFGFLLFCFVVFPWHHGKSNAQYVEHVIVWWLWYAMDELNPSAHLRLEEMPLKYPLSFKRPSTSTACFIFKAYPVTKDTLTPHLDYMWMGGSIIMLYACMLFNRLRGRPITFVNLLPGYRRCGC